MSFLVFPHSDQHDQSATDRQTSLKDGPHSGWIWAAVLFLLLARAVSFFFLKTATGFLFIPRSFVGGGFQSFPALLDLAAPALVFAALFSRQDFKRNRSGYFRAGTLSAAFFLLFPLIAGLSMFAYESSWQFHFNLSVPVFLRFVQFVLAYLTWNLLLDHIGGRWSRFAAALLLATALGLFADASRNSVETTYLLFSVGLTLTWTVLALRRLFTRSPLAATLAATEIGAVVCFLAVLAASDSILVFAISFLALPVAAFTVRSSRRWFCIASVATILSLGLVLSLVVPRFFAPAQRAALLCQDATPAHSEQIDGVTVRYDDPRVRTVALQMAHVLAAANAVSRENYGISPEINELVIRGFEVGGFQAQFPRSIHGNFVSPRQVSLSLNAAFLNGSTASSVDFPDPVNAILHEYSHLYGFVPYRPWLMGAEEEGWATFSATRLSHLLYRRYGASLWVPAYDYSARADAIAQSNLSSHPAFWSHAHEFSGFQLWNHFSDQMGERNLYQQRWNLTQRKEAIWWYQLSDPRAARDFASHFPGLDSLGNFQPIPYGQIYSLQEVQTAGALLGIDPNQVTKNYEQMSRYMIDPAIRVPAPWPSRLDLVLSTFVAAAALALARWKRRTSATVDARTR